MALTVIIILLTLFVYFALKDKKQISLLKNQIESYQNDEILLEENIRILNEKANEVRAVLSLPLINLNSSKSGNESRILEDKNDYLPFYNAIDYIQDYSSKTIMENELFVLLSSGILKEKLNIYDMKIQKTGPSSYNIIKTGNLYFLISAENLKNPSLLFESFTGNKQKFLLENIILNSTELLNYIDSEVKIINDHYAEYNKLKNKFISLNQNNELLNFIKNENLEISNLKTISNNIFYSITNKDKSFNLNLYLDSSTLNFKIDSHESNNYSDFYKYLMKFLIESDKRTEEIKVVDIAKTKVETILNEDSFLSYIEQNNLNINLTPREDNDYFYYDILKADKKPIGSFAVQKIIGDIYLMDPDDIMISSLKYLQTSIGLDNDTKTNIDIPDNLPQIIDKYSDSNSTTFVVIGSHENNADTIILVHADGISGEITLIAIPRDLYYQDKKINDYYRTNGGDKFIEVLSDITGLSIEGYIAVDMYAFIDLINILGGIDITLEADLIDPTYMVRDNGEWSTLYYTKGVHHLNGIESLRIARSRHTTSDFGRTSRQQLVLKGIKDKMSSLDITDLGTILDLFRTLEKYLDTNFSSMEMLSLFLKYKDGDLNRKQGLSTFNVLYNTYTNIYKLKDKSKQYEDGFYRGYWILLPQKNDWNVIKWYIRSLIEDKEI